MGKTNTGEVMKFRGRRRRRGKYSSTVSAGVEPSMKSVLSMLKAKTGVPYAQLIRHAVQYTVEHKGFDTL